jgi:hypothetical protein
LRALIPSTQYHHYHRTIFAIVNPVARTVMDTQFPETTPQTAAIPEIPLFQPYQPLNDSDLSNKVRKSPNPRVKNIFTIHDIMQHLPLS